MTACILLVLGDLMMCILFYDDQQEHELEYKEKIHLILLCVLYGLLCILNAWYVQRPPQDFFIFCIQNVLSLIYIGDECGRNDLKATGGVETFAF